jgi:PAS domain S-box-containing protein
MAKESEHGRIGRGRRPHPGYERLRPDQKDGASGHPLPGGLVSGDARRDKQVLGTHLFEASRDGIALCELPLVPGPGGIIDANERLCRMLGYTREEMRALAPVDLVVTEAKDTVAELSRAAEEGGRISFGIALVGKDRRPIPVEVQIDVISCVGRRVALASVRDATDWHYAIHELERRARQLQKMTLELSETEDRERQRLAEILHDDLQQVLAAAKFQLGFLGSRLQGDPEATQIIVEVKQMLHDAIEKTRGLAHELGPATLSRGNLDGTFAWLAQQMETKHGLVVHLELCGRIDSPSEPVRTFLYRAARELLFNVVKHAQVKEARLRLRRVRNRLRLTVSDQGRGFGPHALAAASGFGLLNVRDRAEVLGGRLRIRSALGKGSTFLIAVPDATAGEAGEIDG